ncbi:uncharacterized protein SCHCODRAFT_02513181 [Schizophyllum commune H4-8]|nr:uncharacterized protein SCHCODRAFT_02513181 [Schizophyllum commune H4-8]KAI5888395.1 hypothetical protein SCHCODRAFT_02513181 [Schizophyllum commune H4-8]
MDDQTRITDIEKDDVEEYETWHIKDVLVKWLAEYCNSVDTQAARAARNFAEAFTIYFDNAHLEARKMEYRHSEALRDFVERVIGFGYCEAMDDNMSFRSHVATIIKHMCLVLDFARENDLISDESDTVRKEILYVQHYHRAVRAFQTLAACYHQAFVVPRVRLGPRRWFVQVMVHDVRSDCVIVGRTGDINGLGSKLDDPEVDYSDLPPDPLKICIPKAASILMQPTDTILGDLYRIDEDHFILGSMLAYRPFDLAHKPIGVELLDEDEADELPFTTPFRDPLRARSFDPAFLVGADGTAYIIPLSIFPVPPGTVDVALTPFNVNHHAFADFKIPHNIDDYRIEALGPPFRAWGPDGLPLHHMRRAHNGPVATLADFCLPHDDIGYRERRARLLSLPSPFDIHAVPVYPQGANILLPGPDYDVAQRAGLMDARPASARRTFLGIPMSSAQSPPGPLPSGHPAYRVFNRPPLPESWYEARDRVFQDDPEDFSEYLPCVIMAEGGECALHA